VKAGFSAAADTHGDALSSIHPLCTAKLASAMHIIASYCPQLMDSHFVSLLEVALEAEQPVSACPSC
jgi:hypothetical protein